MAAPEEDLKEGEDRPEDGPPCARVHSRRCRCHSRPRRRCRCSGRRRRAPREVHGEGVVGLVARHEAARGRRRRRGTRRGSRGTPTHRTHSKGPCCRPPGRPRRAPASCADSRRRRRRRRPPAAARDSVARVRHDGAQKRQRVAVQPAVAAAVAARRWLRDGSTSRARSKDCTPPSVPPLPPPRRRSCRSHRRRCGCG